MNNGNERIGGKFCDDSINDATSTCLLRTFSSRRSKYVLRKSAQLRLQQFFQTTNGRSNLLFLQGRNIVSPPSLSTSLLIPSIETFQNCCENGFLSNFPFPGENQIFMIILQTVLRYVLNGTSIAFQRACKLFLFESPSALRQIMLNEVCSSITIEANLNKISIIDYSNMIFMRTCSFLSSIGYHITILAIDGNDSLLKYINSYNISNVKLLLVADYILNSNIEKSILEKIFIQFEEIQNSRISQNKNSSKDTTVSAKYNPFASITYVQECLKNGTMYSGLLKLFKHSSNYEAEVEVSGVKVQSRHLSSIISKTFKVLIVGKDYINRSFDGDLVAIELLPISEWIHPSSASALSIDDDMLSDNNVNSSEDKKFQKNLLKFPTGKVVCVLKREERKIICVVPMKTLQENSSDRKDEYFLVNPVDKIYPRIRIRSRNWSKLQGCKVLVSLDDWSTYSEFPEGHIIKVFSGERNDWKVHIDALLMQHSIIQRPFSVQALSCLPSGYAADLHNASRYEEEMRALLGSSERKRIPWTDSNWKVPSDELLKRCDLRQSRRVFSVDPPGCQDIDDAMHVHWIQDGLLEVGVSIADATAFIPKGCALDLEAQDRGTTVYMPHSRLDMIPSRLSSDIASLQGHHDRLAITVIWKVRVTKKSNGELVTDRDDVLELDAVNDIQFDFNSIDCDDDAFDVFQSLIHSIAAMTYEQGHRLVNNLSPNIENTAFPPMGQAGQPIDSALWHVLSHDLKLLTVFSRFLKKRRILFGAIEISHGNELNFALDSTGLPVEVQEKEHFEIHSTIEELMIAANETVATILHRVMPREACLRIHSFPSIKKLQEVFILARQIGLNVPNFPEIENTDPNAMFQELQKITRDIQAELSSKKQLQNSDHLVYDWLNRLMITSMTEAKYIAGSSITGVLKDQSHVSEEAKNAIYLGHYGLGLKYYTHFTSPIRRYADMIVHRQILSVILNPNWKIFLRSGIPNTTPVNVISETHPAASSILSMDDNNLLDDLLNDVDSSFLNPEVILNKESSHHDDIISTDKGDHNVQVTNLVDESISFAYSAKQVESMTEHLNIMNRRSKQLQDDCRRLYLQFYFLEKCEHHRGIIYSLRTNGCLIYIPNFDYRGPLHLEYNFNSKESKAVVIDPLLLGLPKTSGESPSDYDKCNHNFKDSTARVFPDITCQLEFDEITTNPKKLHIVSKSSSLPLLTLIPSQMVLVEMSSRSSDNLGNVLPQIQLMLVKVFDESFNSNSLDKLMKYSSTKDMKSEKKTSLIDFINSKSQLMESTAKYLEVSSKAKGKRTKSIYSIGLTYRDIKKCNINPDLHNITQIDSLHLNAEKASSTSKKIKKSKAVDENIKYYIKDSGRRAYGNKDSVSSLFWLHDHSSTSSSDKSINSKENIERLARLSLESSKLAAMEKMKRYGEEWHDEEELPGYSSSYTSNYQSYGSNKVSDDDIFNNNKQSIQKSMQRQTKIKVAKRNSKY